LEKPALTGRVVTCQLYIADMPDAVSVPRQCRQSNIEGGHWCCWCSADTAFIWLVHWCLPRSCSPATFGIFTWALLFV